MGSCADQRKLPLVTVGRGRPVWVEDCHRPEADIRWLTPGFSRGGTTCLHAPPSAASRALARHFRNLGHLLHKIAYRTKD